MSPSHSPKERRLSSQFDMGLILIPVLLASIPLLWFTFGGGERWAASLFKTAHPLNFGGNPNEVFSHLLNCIVMAGSLLSLCIALLTAIRAQTHTANAASSSIFGAGRIIALVVSVSAILGWAAYLDSRSGEGTVFLSFMLFFGPGLALSCFTARKLVSAPASKPARYSAVLIWTAISAAMIPVYEPSGSGAPNIFIIPLLGGQVGLLWLASRIIGDVGRSSISASNAAAENV